jgi:hypothetical protein
MEIILGKIKSFFPSWVGPANQPNPESTSSPPSGFWCLNDKMIKELMCFAMCETEKYLVIMLNRFIHQDIPYDQYDCTS